MSLVTIALDQAAAYTVGALTCTNSALISGGLTVAQAANISGGLVVATGGLSVQNGGGCQYQRFRGYYRIANGLLRHYDWCEHHWVDGGYGQRFRVDAERRQWRDHRGRLERYKPRGGDNW